MKKIILLLIPLLLLGLGCRKSPEAINVESVSQDGIPVAIEAPERPLATFFKIQTNDIFGVNGLLFEVKNITSLTNQGCLGGPTGCPDNVELQISFEGETQNITLVVLGGEMQTASSERIVFGHRVVLSSVSQNEAMLGVFIAPATSTSTNASY